MDLLTYLRCYDPGELVRLSSLEQLIVYRQEKDVLTEQLTADRDQLRKEIRRNIPEEMRNQKKEQITAITERLRDLRKEIKLCIDIEERSPVIEEKLRRIEEERNRERSER